MSNLAAPPHANTKILVIEDDPLDVILLLRKINKSELAALEPRIESCGDLQQIRARIASDACDVILCDYNLASFNAFDVLDLLREHQKDIPMLVVSGTVKEETAVSLMKAGAADFVNKENLSRLVPAIQREMAELRNRKARRERDAQLRVLSEAIPHLVWSQTPDGKVDYYNQQWRAFAGLPAQSPLDWMGHVATEDRAALTDAVITAQSTGAPMTVECRLKSIEGRPVWHLVRMVPVFDERNRVVKWFGTATEIEAQKRALLAKEEFLSIASHELNTPLTPLKAQLEMARRLAEKDPATPPKIAPLIQGSLKQVQEIVQMVDTLLDVVRPRRHRTLNSLCEFDLSELVEECLQEKRPELDAAGCPLEARVQPDIVGCWDRERVRRTLLQLLNNAAKHAPRNQVDVTLELRGDTAVFSVQDRGPGIARSDQQRIFERYERLGEAQEVSGWGVGLFLAKQTVTDHHGRISVRSEPGRGATFVVELPCDLVPEGGI